MNGSLNVFNWNTGTYTLTINQRYKCVKFKLYLNFSLLMFRNRLLNLYHLKSEMLTFSKCPIWTKYRAK